MKKVFLFTVLIISLSAAKAQTIISVTPFLSFTAEQVDSVLAASGLPTNIVGAENGVDIYKVLYNTISFDSVTPTYASGAIMLPKDATCKVPLISYQHGTVVERVGVPSYFAGEAIIGLAFAAQGYALSMPDYLGLGESPGFHPYIHARSEASASLDMLRATHEAQDSIEGFDLNGQLFLMGYSQGGHSTMALHRLIETTYPNEFEITASAPMSGPYDVSGVQAAVIVNDSVYSQPGYLPYILTSYNMVYGFLNDISDVLLSPYDTLLPPLLDGVHNMGELNAAMPAIPNQIMIPAVLDSFRNDPNHYFREALRDNDVYDWTPVAPTKMFFCEADDEVYYLNAQVAYDRFIDNGATSVSLQSAGEEYDHFTCALFALMGGRNWFDTFRNDRMELSFEVENETDMGFDGSIELTIEGGVAPFHVSWMGGDTGTTITDLTTGTYYVTVIDSNGCSASDSVTVSNISGIFSDRSKLHFKVYPNPASDLTTIELSNELNNGYLRLTDVSGKLVKQLAISGTNKIQINTSRLDAGIYFVSILENGKTVGRNKLAINR